MNGFLPRSVGIGGRWSPLVNVVDFDLRYNVPSAPLMFFSRLQLLPRFTGTGDETRPSAAAGVRAPGAVRFAGVGAERRQVRLGRRYRVPGQRIEHPHRHHAVAGGALHDRTVAGGQGVLSRADPRGLVGGQPESGRHDQRQLRRVAADARRLADRRARRQRSPRLRAEPAALSAQAGRQRRLWPAQRPARSARVAAGRRRRPAHRGRGALPQRRVRARRRGRGPRTEDHQPGRVPAGLGVPRARRTTRSSPMGW